MNEFLQAELFDTSQYLDSDSVSMIPVEVPDDSRARILDNQLPLFETMMLGCWVHPNTAYLQRLWTDYKGKPLGDDRCAVPINDTSGQR